jgi:transposase-like protein
MAKKGQTLTKYSEELKKEAVRLHIEEHMSYSQILEKLNIKSDAQLVRWIRKFKSGETFEDRRGKGGRKHFDSKDEEIAYLKAQVEYLKKLNPNLHGEGSWIQKPGVNPFKK